MPSAIATALVELRQYRLHPGSRETLIALFDREFVESQENCGMTVIGQFRDLDDPDRFVWLRGFSDMEERARALEAFYGGTVWARHREAANATMIAFDDVYLLRLEAGLPAPRARPPRDARGDGDGYMLAVILPLASGARVTGDAGVMGAVAEALRAAGGEILGSLRTEESPNDWPRLPVRADGDVTVLLAGFADQAALDHGLAAAAVQADLHADLLARSPEIRRLRPTARSALRLRV